MGSGGSRFGAGRPGWRPKIEQCLRLDVRQLARKGLLRPGNWSAWRWWNSYTRDETGSVSILAERGRIDLRYQRGDQPVISPIRLTYTPCHYGGSRPWFICPNCWRRCGVIAFGRGGWACRECLHLAYSCEAEDAMGRLWRKQGKLEARLGPDGERPKGMHWRTYERLWDRIEEIEARKDEVLFASVLPYLALMGCT